MLFAYPAGHCPPRPPANRGPRHTPHATGTGVRYTEVSHRLQPKAGKDHLADALHTWGAAPHCGEEVDQKESASVGAVGIGSAAGGRVWAAVSDSQPEVVVGSPGSDFHEAVGVVVASMCDGVGNQFGGDQKQRVGELHTGRAQESLLSGVSDGAADAGDAGRVSGVAALNGEAGWRGSSGGSGGHVDLQSVEGRIRLVAVRGLSITHSGVQISAVQACAIHSWEVFRPHCVSCAPMRQAQGLFLLRGDLSDAPGPFPDDPAPPTRR